MSTVSSGASSRLDFLSNRLLHLIIMPTEQCNFRCVYCYEDFIQPRMPSWVVAAVRRWMSHRAPDLDSLAVEWFGGEPMLEHDLICELQAHARQLERQHAQLTVRGSMTTNGSLLTRDRFAELLALGVDRFQISLDGDAESHDVTRITRAGGKTFKKIWQNLMQLREIPEAFEITLRLHVTRDNSASLGRLLRRCQEAFANDPRWRVSLQAVRRLGGPNDQHLAVFEDEARLQATLVELRKLSVEAGLSVDRGPFAGPSPFVGCYAAAANSFVVRSNGDLAKCTVALNDPRNKVGRLRPDGSLELESTKVSIWLRGLLSGRPTELQCPKVGLPELPARRSSLPVL